MSGYTIRPARPDDADELGRVHIQVWRQAYTGLMDQRFLDELDPETAAERWRTMLSAPPDGLIRLVGVTGDDIVGFITSGPARDDNPPTATELMAINVLASHHGTGLADRLVADALGDVPVYLWVVDGNERAQAFYRRHGFVLDGVTKLHERTGALELRMTRGPVV